MAKADQQPALTFVSLKAVCDALENRAGESTRSVKRFIVRGMGDRSLRYKPKEDLPPSFFRSPDSFTFDGSDMINPVAEGGYAYTLLGVSLAWEDVVKAYPELGAEPHELGKSRMEVSFAAPLTKWLETLVRRLGALWRTPAPKVWKKGEERKWLSNRIDQDPPGSGYGEKTAWSERALKDMEADFAGNQGWRVPDAVRRKVDEELSNRRRRKKKQ